MKNKSLLTSIYFVLIIVVSIGLYFVFEITLPIHKSVPSQTIYWIAKGFSLLFILLVLIFVLQKNEFVNKIIFIRTTIAWQFIPFVMRLLLLQSSDSQRIVISSVVLAISILGYVGLYFMIVINSEKIKQTSDRLRGENKQVKDSSEYYDKNNNFIGSEPRKEGDNV